VTKNCISASSVQAGLNTVRSPDDTRSSTGKLRAARHTKVNMKNGSVQSHPNLRYLILSFIAFIAFDSMVSGTDIGLLIKPILSTDH